MGTRGTVVLGGEGKKFKQGLQGEQGNWRIGSIGNKGNWGNKENKGRISVHAKISLLLLIVYSKNYLNAAVHPTRK